MMEKLKFLAVAAFLMIAGISCSNSSSKKSEQTVSVSAQAEVKEGTLIVQGNCDMCKTRIEEAAGKVSGVSSASWNMETKELTFDYDPAKTSPESISKAIAAVGHDTNLDLAPDSVYNTLHECCKYREN
ncbi:MAG: cation transporter [Candidatus Azobacteroides sp.]|nr:cation transporter [Candidatus Azobacteroides sp.]